MASFGWELQSLKLYAMGLVWLWFFHENPTTNPLVEASINQEGRMLVYKAHDELVNGFATEILGLITDIEQKPNADKLTKWGWGDTEG